MPRQRSDEGVHRACCSCDLPGQVGGDSYRFTMHSGTHGARRQRQGPAAASGLSLIPRRHTLHDGLLRSRGLASRHELKAGERDGSGIALQLADALREEEGELWPVRTARARAAYASVAAARDAGDAWGGRTSFKLPWMRVRRSTGAVAGRALGSAILAGRQAGG